MRNDIRRQSVCAEFLVCSVSRLHVYLRFPTYVCCVCVFDWYVVRSLCLPSQSGLTDPFVKWTVQKKKCSFDFDYVTCITAHNQFGPRRSLCCSLEKEPLKAQLIVSGIGYLRAYH